MHRCTGMQEGRRGSKVAVLDTIHGAAVIARKMVERGWQAEAFEVYHHTPDLSSFDLIVSPVHLSPHNPALEEARREGKTVITHHQAVGDLLRQDASAWEIFEVTGTHSKTSTALLLAFVLSRHRKVVSHTTRGLEIWQDGRSTILQKGLSIAPANVIRAVQAAEDGGATSLICEVSLGGTGLADYGILTSLFGDYMIASGSKWASTAKLQMLSLAKRGMRFIANSETRISSDYPFGSGSGIYACSDRLVLGKEKAKMDLGVDLDFPGYQTAISAAAAAAHAAGLGCTDISEALFGFDGFPGRMKIRRLGHQTIFDGSNSGLKVRDVERALDRARGPDLVAVVGEESKTVCEGMDIPVLSDLLRRRKGEIARLILVGERLQPLAEEL
ncbi:MAG: coenzyme F430 synthase, partial [Methanothrix sp.]|nr:coenzyme F430 synthase [Methanothrix sp.]